MSNSIRISGNSHNMSGGAGRGRIGAVCKQILNNVAAIANRPVERDRFAALSMRQLEDIGMTIAERDDMLR
jgi:hypothetical protein